MSYNVTFTTWCGVKMVEKCLVVPNDGLNKNPKDFRS